jgi:hypothetical protein
MKIIRALSHARKTRLKFKMCALIWFNSKFLKLKIKL